MGVLANQAQWIGGREDKCHHAGNGNHGSIKCSEISWKIPMLTLYLKKHWTETQKKKKFVQRMCEASFTRVAIVPPESPFGGATEQKNPLKSIF